MKWKISMRVRRDRLFARRWSQLLPGLILLYVAGLMPTAHAQAGETVCGPDIKEEVVNALAKMADVPADKKLAMEAELYEKYQYCAQDNQSAQGDDNFFVAARQCGAQVSHLGDELLWLRSATPAVRMSGQGQATFRFWRRAFAGKSRIRVSLC